jgi:Domain of unknown function (DUF4864)
MRFVGWVLLVLLALPVWAQNADDAIQGVISQQFEAFRADDFGRAFEFASPAIRGRFGTTENFGQMVREGYPMVWRPGSIRFGGLEDIDGRMVQRVFVTDAAGRLHELQYEMIATGDGWKINGVRVMQPESTGV